MFLHKYQVKIQHDREQYDKEQIERQMQAQQSANLTHVESKILENKVILVFSNILFKMMLF